MRFALDRGRDVGEQYESCTCGSDGEPSSHPCRSGHGAVQADALHEDDLRLVSDRESYVLAGEGGEVVQVRQCELAYPLAAGRKGSDLPQPQSDSAASLRVPLQSSPGEELSQYAVNGRHGRARSPGQVTR